MKDSLLVCLVGIMSFVLGALMVLGVSYEETDTSSNTANQCNQQVYISVSGATPHDAVGFPPKK